MDDVKKAEIRGLLAAVKIIVPEAKDLEQLESEANQGGADLRAYCLGYLQGAQDWLDFPRPNAVRKVAARERNDITNLWGLIP